MNCNKNSLCNLKAAVNGGENSSVMFSVWIDFRLDMRGLKMRAL